MASYRIRFRSPCKKALSGPGRDRHLQPECGFFIPAQIFDRYSRSRASAQHIRASLMAIRVNQGRSKISLRIVQVDEGFLQLCWTMSSASSPSDTSEASRNGKNPSLVSSMRIQMRVHSTFGSNDDAPSSSWSKISVAGDPQLSDTRHRFFLCPVLGIFSNLHPRRHRVSCSVSRWPLTLASFSRDPFADVCGQFLEHERTRPELAAHLANRTGARWRRGCNC